MKQITSEYGIVQIDGDDYSPLKYVTAIPNDGYQFFGWTGDTEGIDEKDPSIVINLIAVPYKKIYANFVRATTYFADVTQTQHGTVVCENNPNDYAWQKTFVAQPDNGYKFSNWIEETSNGYINSSNRLQNPLWIQLRQDAPLIRLKAVFVQNNDYTKITYADGTISYIEVSGTLEYDQFRPEGGLAINSTIVSVRLGDVIDALGNSCFANCTALTALQMPNALTSIGTKAFQNTSLYSFDFSKLQISSIPDDAFSNTLISSVDRLQDTVNAIGQASFYECYQLTGISIPSSISKVDDYAFYSCPNLVSIDLRSFQGSLPQIYEDTFDPCDEVPGRTVYLNSRIESKIARSSKGPWKSLYQDVDPQIDVWQDIDTKLVFSAYKDIGIYGYLTENATACEVVFIDKEETIQTFQQLPNMLDRVFITYKSNTDPHKRSEISATIENVLCAFSCNSNGNKCISVESIGSNISYLPNEAFSYMSLSSITIPWTVNKLGYCVFEGNPMTIDDIIFEDDDCLKLYDNWVVMSNGECVNLFNNTLCKTFDISTKYVTKLSLRCFSNAMSIQKISLPSSLTSIQQPLVIRPLTNLTSITIDSQNKFFKVENGKLMSKNGKTIYLQTRSAT